MRTCSHPPCTTDPTEGGTRRCSLVLYDLSTGTEPVHWAALWGEAACGLPVREAHRLIVASREALCTAALDHITCAKCRVRAEALMYSVARL